MSKFIGKIFATTIAALFAAWLLHGVHIADVTTAFFVAVVLALLNSFIKPVLVILTIPITVLTLGLFLLVINILIIKLAAHIVTGFDVDGWWTALLFSIIVSVVTSMIEGILGTNKKKKA